MPAEMIRDDKTATYPNDPNVWTVVCHDHTPRFHRNRLAEPHAANVVRKHDREQHPQPEFHIGRVAALVIAADEDYHLARQDADPDKAWAATFAQRRLEEVLAMWMTLCAIPLSERDTAMARAREAAREDVVAHVAPF